MTQICAALSLLLVVTAVACSSSDNPVPDAARDGSRDVAGTGGSAGTGGTGTGGTGTGGATADASPDVVGGDSGVPDAGAGADAALDAAASDAATLDASVDAPALEAGAPDSSLAADAVPDGALPSDSAPGGFVASAPWADAAAIDPMYTCAGGQHFPTFAWSPGPAGTLSYALVFFDTANSVVHLALTNIPASASSVPPLPAGSQLGPDSMTTTSTTWSGPCPMGVQHVYRLTVYALRTASYTGEATSDDAIRASLDDAGNPDVLGRAVVTGTSSATEP